MKVVVKYVDHNSPTMEEAELMAKSVLGSNASVSIIPDSNSEYSSTFFNLQKYHAADIQTIVLDDTPNVQGRKLAAMKEAMLETYSSIFDDLVAHIEDAQ